MKDLISNERFVNALLFVHDKYGYLNRSVIYLERPLGNISYDWYLLKFHGIQKFCSDNQLNYQHGLAIDKDYIIEQCTEIYNKYGKLSKKICLDNGIHASSIHRLFGGFTNLYKELGIEPNQEIEVDKVGNKIVITNPKGMKTKEEIEKMYDDIKKLAKSEYDKGFIHALEMVLNK